MYDTTLPSTPSLPAAFGIIEKNLIDSASKEQTLQNKLEWAELCLDYRMNPYFSTWLANSMKHEASSSPWKWNDKRTVPFLSDKRFNRFAVPYHSLSHNELDSLLQQLKQTDLLNKSYFYLWDEPTYMKEYHLIGQYSQEIHKLMPEAKVLTTFYCGPKDGKYKDRLFSVFDLWRGDTQIFSMSAWALQANEANADTCRSLLRGNEEWWTYVCMGPGEEQPNLLLTMDGYQHRAVLWRSWKERTTGFLYWAVNAYAESDTLAFRKDLPEGDGVLIYPGQYFNSTSPVVSIRMERWRDSMEDYEYLAKLEKKIGRAKSETLFQSIYQSPEKYIENYKQTLKNLKEAGVKVVCYNFMPVFDWTRTDLFHPVGDGSTALYYEKDKIIDDPKEMAKYILEKCEGFTMPGWEPERMAHLTELFDAYKDVTKEKLWENLRYFLEALMPTCRECDIKLAIHQDDPPWDIFGLPRLLVDEPSIDRFLKMVDDPYNCLTLCSGSLSSNPKNNVADIVRKHCDRIAFAHIRNVKHFPNGDFSEASHRDCDGDTGILDIVKAYHDCGFTGYVRPDHGRHIWGEKCRPGYGLYDRALGIMYLLGCFDTLEKFDNK